MYLHRRTDRPRGGLIGHHEGGLVRHQTEVSDLIVHERRVSLSLVSFSLELIGHDEGGLFGHVEGGLIGQAEGGTDWT